MRRSLRFFSRCSSSSVIVRSPVEQKVFACHTARSSVPTVQIVKSITSASRTAPKSGSRGYRTRRSSCRRAKRHHLAAPLFQPRDILGQFGSGGDNGLLFGMRIGTRRLCPRGGRCSVQQDSLVLGFGNAPGA